MIKLKDGDCDDEPCEASSTFEDTIDTHTITPKQEAGSWCWVLQEDSTPSNIETHYRRLVFVPDTDTAEQEDYSIWDNSRSFLVLANDETNDDDDNNNHNNNDEFPVAINTEDFLPDGSTTVVDTTTTVGNRTIQDDDRSAAVVAFDAAVSNDRERNFIPGERRGWRRATDGGRTTTPAAVPMDTTGTRKREIEFEIVDSVEIGNQPLSTTTTLHRPRQRRCRRDDFERGDETNTNNNKLSDIDTEDSMIPGDTNVDKEDGCNNRDSCGSNSVPFNYNDHQWMKLYYRLEAHIRKYKIMRVPEMKKQDPQLGQWVNTQRLYCKDKDRIYLLNAIGFVWKSRTEWETMYQRLLAYQKIHRTTCVPVSYKPDPQLGRWVFTQRQACKMKDRIDRLNAIGFVWRLVNRRDWGEMYRRLVVYQKKHNSTRVPKKYEADPQLANWVDKNRTMCREKDRIDLLNKIGFEWRLTERIDWMVMYRRLVAYKQKHGTTCVPTIYKADLQLGRWVRTQYGFCRKDRVDLLNDIGFVWNACQRNQHNAT